LYETVNNTPIAVICSLSSSVNEIRDSAVAEGPRDTLRQL